MAVEILGALGDAAKPAKRLGNAVSRLVKVSACMGKLNHLLLRAIRPFSEVQADRGLLGLAQRNPTPFGGRPSSRLFIPRTVALSDSRPSMTKSLTVKTVRMT